MDDEDDMLGWHVDDHSHDDLTLIEYDRSLSGYQFKLAWRGKDNSRIVAFQLIMCPLHY